MVSVKVLCWRLRFCVVGQGFVLSVKVLCCRFRICVVGSGFVLVKEETRIVKRNCTVYIICK